MKIAVFVQKNQFRSGAPFSFINLKAVSVLFILLINQLLFAQTGTWTKVTNLAPHNNMGVMLLLTDGTIICHNTNGGTYGMGWDKLTPDASGSYANGTWTSIASMANDRLFSTQVLPTGKVYAAGGEYGAGTSAGEVYDPVANTWTACGAIPVGWKIYDGNSQLLYTGNILEGPQIGANNSFNILQWSPTTLAYTTEANSPCNHDEAEWVKLRDSSVLFVGIASTNSCRFLPKTNTWVNDGVVPVNLYDPYGEEAGCGFMLPNGKAAFFGATQHNAIYTPSGNASPGSWAAASDFPTIGGTLVGQTDASGAMMVNGHILLAVSPIGTSANDEFRDPTYFVEYDYTNNTFTQVTALIPGQNADSLKGISCYMTNMLDLPDGNVLVSIDQSSLSKQYFIYTPGSAAIPQGKPVINSILPNGCPSYKITGKLFNGISEGAAYGDDWQMSTNWPIVRLTNGSNVYYAKTTYWNRLGAVRTDSLEDTTIFTPPAGLPGGTYSLTVVVNGFASNPTIFKTLSTTISSFSNVLCNGGAGTATTQAAGGISPYTYLWAPSGGTGATGTGLSAGTYTIKVTDNNGCTTTANVSITQPSALSITIASISNVLCNGGSGSVTANSAAGGISPYTYLWAPSGGSNLAATGLLAGTYTITAKDNNGCSVTASATITQPIQLTVSATAMTNVTCNSGNDGSAIATPGGGTSPYVYLWTGGGTNALNAGLSANTYTVTVFDNNGCSATASVTITQPTLLAVTTNAVENVTCIGGNNGIVSANVAGGTSPYNYAWTGGGTNATDSNLTIGTYLIIVTDNNGCTTSASATITQPSALSVSASVINNIECHGKNSGSVSSGPVGGTSPYTYSWTGGGTNATESGLSIGTYIVTIHDNCGGIATASATITQVAAMVIRTDSVNVVGTGACNGKASVTVISGGTAPYTYNWSPGGATTDTIKNKCAGSYCCTVTDNNGCTSSTCVVINTKSTTGIESMSDLSAITIYPNPNNGSFNITGIMQGQVIELYNNLGQKLSNVMADKTTMYFNISGRADGIYLIRILNTDGSLATQQKVLKTQ